MIIGPDGRIWESSPGEEWVAVELGDPSGGA